MTPSKAETYGRNVSNSSSNETTSWTFTPRTPNLLSMTLKKACKEFCYRTVKTFLFQRATYWFRLDFTETLPKASIFKSGWCWRSLEECLFLTTSIGSNRRAASAGSARAFYYAGGSVPHAVQKRIRKSASLVL